MNVVLLKKLVGSMNLDNISEPVMFSPMVLCTLTELELQSDTGQIESDWLIDCRVPGVFIWDSGEDPECPAKHSPDALIFRLAILHQWQSLFGDEPLPVSRVLELLKAFDQWVEAYDGTWLESVQESPTVSVGAD